jgi:histidyl-tRNA synthetase
MTLQESTGAAAQPTDIYIAPLGPGMNVAAAGLARELRRQDVVVSLGDESFRLKKSLETASKTGALYALIVGENEVNSGQFALKNLGTGEQVSVTRDQIAPTVKAQR